MDDDKYQKYESERASYSNAILKSDSDKKIIVAGPGTGKSFVFQEICKNNVRAGIHDNLVLSFINELVDDLKVELHGLAEVRTLHSFAISNLPKNNNIFMGLDSIIEEDYEIINAKKIDYKKIFCNLIDSNEELKFYSKRRKYYNYFGPHCSLYALIKIFENDKNKIPKFSQILIDEFQDFNKLEAKLIDLLSDKSPILIVGDDDQSLYSFKHANPNEIRLRRNDPSYSFFQLPFCSRCTAVIIKAFNSVVEKAKENGFLKARLKKDYIYFPTFKKDRISNENPKILIKKEVFQKTVAYHFEKEIKKVVHPKQKDISILIICPLKKQIRDLVERLYQKGFSNISSPQDNANMELFDVFKMLTKDNDSNLGWRIISKYILSDRKKYEDIIRDSHSKNEEIAFKSFLEEKEVAYVKNILISLNKLNQNKEISAEEYSRLLDCFKYNHQNIILNKLKNDLEVTAIQKANVYNKISIKITTILGSKGLTSDYVFLVNFDDKYLLDKNKITDENICRYLVALTRASRKIYIFTSQKDLPIFAEWINSEFYEIIS